MLKIVIVIIFLVLTVKISRGQQQEDVNAVPVPVPVPVPVLMSMVDVEDGMVMVKKISRTTQPSVPSDSDSDQDQDSPLVFTRVNCHKVILTMFNRIVDVIEGCADQVKKNHSEKGEFAKYFQCALKCSMKKLQMLDDHDLLTTESFTIFANAHLPKLIHPLFFHVMENCIQIHSRIIAASANDDPQCLTYGNFLRCAKNYVTKNC